MAAVQQAMKPPSLIEYKTARFLITDAPTDGNLATYLQVFEQHNVVTVARTCEPSYSVEALNEAGISVEELAFPDGAGPPEEVVREWLTLVRQTFKDPSQQAAIAIHCVAGLGRAPVLVAIALVELGMDKLDAIAYIRERRPKAFNVKQIHYVENYKRSSKKNCAVM